MHMRSALHKILLLALLLGGVTAQLACSTACSNVSSGAIAVTVDPQSFGVAVCLQGSAVVCALQPVTLYVMLDPTVSPVQVTAAYDTVAIGPSSWSGVAVVSLPGGAEVMVSDTWSGADAAVTAAFTSTTVQPAMTAFTRTCNVLQAPGSGSPGAGFGSALSLPLLPSLSPASYRVLMPGLQLNDGGAASGAAWVPPYAIAGNASRPAVAREDRMAAPLAVLVQPGSGVAAGVIRPSAAVPNTILNDTLFGTPVVDSRMTFTAMGYEPSSSGNGTSLVVVYPGSEYGVTYQSGARPDAGHLWRMHPLAIGTVSSFSTVVALANISAAGTGVSISDADSVFHATLQWAWRGAEAYYSPGVPPSLRVDLNLTDAWHAVLDALADCYVPATPLPGVPTGYDKMSGVAYSPVLELGFVGPQLRMAVSLLYAGLSTANDTKVGIAAAMLDAWASITGPGYGHAVWNMQTNSWIDDPASAAATGAAGAAGVSTVYLRRQVVAHHHALEAAELVLSSSSTNATLRARAAVWQAWGLSLAPQLLALQYADGSWARQYALPADNSSEALPTPSQPSKTATALPVRYLVSCYNATGNASYLAAAVAAGQFAWDTFGSRDLYVGAAIDNPDVMDKESALFATDSFLALYDGMLLATARGVSTGAAAPAGAWLQRAADAALVASTWVQITHIPNPVDSPAMDFSPTDTSVGFGLIAVGHSGSDSFASLQIAPLLRLCALTGDTLYARFAALAAANTQQPLDLSGAKGYAHRGFASELFAFSVGWDVFSGHNDGRGIGDPHFVPWTAANAAYGMAQLCWLGGTRNLPQGCNLDQLLAVPC